MNHKLTVAVSSFLWTYLALTGLLVQWQNNQPHTVTLEVSS